MYMSVAIVMVRSVVVDQAWCLCVSEYVCVCVRGRLISGSYGLLTAFRLSKRSPVVATAITPSEGRGNDVSL